MKADQHKQVEFVKDCLRNGEQRAIILQKFASVYKNLSIKTFDNRLKVAKKQIESEFKTIAIKSEENIGELIKERTFKILSVAERMDILAKMANGELERNEVVFIDGQPKQIKAKPTFNDMRGAIAELNKMQGDYAPAKSEISVTEKPKIIFPGDEPTDD